ncbi:MAG TPA: hypothetical protein VN193_17560 [Candidatus Angelobacter sp.]|jgi:hypothetical protein|nr:hypothetical protein [Candidatus Angelobacter sp.]
MSKPVARGSVLVHLPIDEVDRDFARDVGAQGEGGSLVITRLGPGRYASEARAGLARVLGEFELERADLDETVVHATLWVRPRFFGVMARVVLGRRRLQRGVDAALVRMARKATGDDQVAEFGPEDFADEPEPEPRRDGERAP